MYFFVNIINKFGFVFILLGFDYELSNSTSVFVEVFSRKGTWLLVGVRNILLSLLNRLMLLYIVIQSRWMKGFELLFLLSFADFLKNLLINSDGFFFWNFVFPDVFVHEKIIWLQGVQHNFVIFLIFELKSQTFCALVNL